jgi:hypothetical protein
MTRAAAGAPFRPYRWRGDDSPVAGRPRKAPKPPLPGEEEITVPVSGDTAAAGKAAHADAAGPGTAGPPVCCGDCGYLVTAIGHRVTCDG